MTVGAGCDQVPPGELEAVSYPQALRCFEQRALPVDGTEVVPLRGAAGRVLATDVTAPRDVPAFDNSAVDGLAFAWSPTLKEGGVLSATAGRSQAGRGFTGRVAAGHAVTVLTGAPMPAGTDTVAPIEACRPAAGRWELPAGLVAGTNRRNHGEDMAAGTLLLTAGSLLGPRQIAVAASLGIADLAVRRRVRVVLFSTGDELLPPGEPWREAGVYDANRPLLAALMDGLPVELVDLGIVPDERTRLAAVLDSLDHTDLVVGSGGASRGEEDHVAALLAERDALDFWRAAIRPGRPLALGGLGGTVFVALPGNPVAACICFLRFVRPMLLAMAGAGWFLPAGRPLPASQPIARKPQRTELLRCRCITDQNGREALLPLARQGSGMLSTLLEADGIAEVEPGNAPVAQGALLPFLSWQDLGINF